MVRYRIGRVEDGLWHAAEEWGEMRQAKGSKEAKRKRGRRPKEDRSRSIRILDSASGVKSYLRSVVELMDLGRLGQVEWSEVART